MKNDRRCRLRYSQLIHVHVVDCGLEHRTIDNDQGDSAKKPDQDGLKDVEGIISAAEGKSQKKFDR